MRYTKFFSVLLAVTMFSLFSSFKTSESAIAEWKFLGDKSVRFGVDRDVIHCGNINDDFRQVKLKVTDGPLKMYSLKIYFDNGSEQSVELRNRFAQGSESRIIDLEGGLRRLSKIEFWYETKGFIKGRSRVAVWGRK